MLFPFPTEDGEELESMWVEPTEPNLFVVKNAPFYVRGVSAEDVVRGRHDAEGLLRFERIERHSGHSTVRVIFFDDARRQGALDELCSLGCSFEGADTPGLFAIDVPAEASWPVLQETLRRLSNDGVLDWEEPAISGRHDAQS